METTQIIVALDFASPAQAMKMVERLGPGVRSYKVGLQLLTVAGPSFVRELVALGKHVFLDLKLFEIPNSVGGAIQAAGQLGVDMVTVHASAGAAVMRAAVAAARPFPQLKVLALTVITSMGDEDLREIGIDATVDEQVTRLARLAIDAGCHGLVASAREAQWLRGMAPKDYLIVTPGIQLPGDPVTDQVRTATPAAAIRAGASHIVMGRAITAAARPLTAFAAACADIESTEAAAH